MPKLSLIAGMATIHVLAFMVTTPAGAGVFDRPMHITYAISGGKSLTQSDPNILRAFESLSNMPTMLAPVILNRDPAKHHDFVTSLLALCPDIFFGVGKSSWNLADPFYWDKMISRAQDFRVYGDCIRIDHFKSIVLNSGEDKTAEYLVALHDMGFAHIMINPWYNPRTRSDWPYVDSTFIGIRHGTDWLPKVDRMTAINASWPWVNIVNNYENAPGHVALAAMTIPQQQATFQLALDHRKTFWLPYGIAFPWSHNYDLLETGTLPWMDDNYYYANKTVSYEHFSIMAAAWDSVLGDINYNENCDLVDSNSIDIEDFRFFDRRWQRICDDDFVTGK